MTSLTMTQFSVRGGRARQQKLTPAERSELGRKGALASHRDRCVCGHRKKHHRADRIRGVDVTDCEFAANQVACLCTEYRPRGDRLSLGSLRAFAAECLVDATAMRSGLAKLLETMPSAPRCRIKSHAGRPMDPKRKGFCVPCAQRQRAQDKESWRKRHGREAT